MVRHCGRWVAGGLVAAILGCGGPAFEQVAGDSGLGDARSAEGGSSDSPAATEATAPLDGSSDGSSDVRASDSPADAMGPCAPLSSSATDVYVDQRSTAMPQYGVEACPFPTILQGLAAAARLTGTVTVHVAGATPALTYAETAAVAVPANVVLSGGGAAHTTISANGTCGAGTCAVAVSAGGAAV